MVRKKPARLVLFILLFGLLLVLLSCNQNSSKPPPAQYFGESVRVFSGKLDNYNSGEACPKISYCYRPSFTHALLSMMR